MPKSERTDAQKEWLRTYFFAFGCKITDDDLLLDIKTNVHIATIKKIKWKSDGIAQIEITTHTMLNGCG